MLGADARVVEARGDRVRVDDLAVLVREDRRPRRRGGRRRARFRGSPRRPPRPRRARRPRRPRTRRRDRSRSSRRPHRRRRRPAGGPQLSSACSRASRPMTDCSSAHDRRIRMRADAGADEVVRRLDVRDPVADRLARRLLQRARPELDGLHLGPEKPHALDVRVLPAHVLGAHVDDALEPEAGAHGRGRDAVLARAGLRDDAPLAEPDASRACPTRVVDLVRAGVAEVLALEQDPAASGSEALGLVERRRAADVPRAELVELRGEAPDRRRPRSKPRSSSSSAGISVSGT